MNNAYKILVGKPEGKRSLGKPWHKWKASIETNLREIGNGTRDSFPGGKRPGREADHSSSSSAEVKNTWIYTSTDSYVSMAWCLIKHGIHLNGVVHN
jgi:hypothetical protein